MKSRHFGMVVISLTVAGVAFPVRAASLPTNSANPASVAVEDVPDGSNTAPWSACDSHPIIERSNAGQWAGDILVNEAPWKSALAERPAEVGQAANIDSMSLLASPAWTLSDRTGIDRDTSACDQTREVGQTVGPIGLPETVQPGESRLAWVALLMLLPMIGGVFIAWDVRGARRRHDEHHLAGAFLYDAPSSPSQRAPVPLAALGLTADCSEEDVKRAFRQQAMSAHPDRGGSARDFMALEGHFQESLRIVRGAAMRAQYLARRSSPSRQAA